MSNWLLNVVAVVGQIDLHGYQGRANHPEPTDAGRAGRLIGMTIQEFEAAPREDVNLYRVRFSDGRIVDLVEHEVSVIYSERTLTPSGSIPA